jgi:gamma-glutamyltranspeptidase/glutathione hydrolase
MVSYIQSNYQCFGSGVVLPGSGIAFQDRGANFDLDPDSVNCIAPGKRPYHTIIPGFLTCDGQAVGPFGVMGGFMQPQGHVQLITNMLDFGMNPQEALDCPRWQWTGGRHFEVERGIPASCIEELRNRGHEIDIVDDMTVYGRGQMICRNQEGVLMGATEPRADGTVAAW